MATAKAHPPRDVCRLPPGYSAIIPETERKEHADLLAAFEKQGGELLARWSGVHKRMMQHRMIGTIRNTPGALNAVARQLAAVNLLESCTWMTSDGYAVATFVVGDEHPDAAQRRALVAHVSENLHLETWLGDRLRRLCLDGSVPPPAELLRDDPSLPHLLREASLVRLHARLPPRYRAVTTESEQVEHVELLSQLEQPGAPNIVSVCRMPLPSDAWAIEKSAACRGMYSPACSALRLLCAFRDHPGMLSCLSAASTQSGANMLEASIFATCDHFVVCSVLLERVTDYPLYPTLVAAAQPLVHPSAVKRPRPTKRAKRNNDGQQQPDAPTPPP